MDKKKLLSIIHTYLILWVTRGKNWNILLLDLCSTSVLQITTSKMVTYVFYIQSHPPVRIFFLFFLFFKGYVLCCKNSLHNTRHICRMPQQLATGKRQIKLCRAEIISMIRCFSYSLLESENFSRFVRISDSVSQPRTGLSK